MLRDAGVRTKLLAVLAIPTLLLVVVTGLLVDGQVAGARRAGQINALTEVAVQVNTVVHSLQEERSITLNYLQAPSAAAKARVKAQRHFTDRQLSELRKLVAASPVDQMSEAVRAAVARSSSSHSELRGARASVDAGRFFATETDVFYTRVIRTDLELPGVLAATGTADLGSILKAYQSLSRTIEFASHERDLVEQALTTGALERGGVRAGLRARRAAARVAAGVPGRRAGRVVHPARRQARRDPELRDRPGPTGPHPPPEGHPT
jgi:hypothetical protein